HTITAETAEIAEEKNLCALGVLRGECRDLGHRRRTSIDSACAVNPSASASGTIVGRSRARPALVTRCTDITRMKSAALRPPRKRAAPDVGSTWFDPVA